MNKIFFAPKFTNLNGTQNESSTPTFYFECWCPNPRIHIFEYESKNCVSSFKISNYN